MTSIRHTAAFIGACMVPLLFAGPPSTAADDKAQVGAAIQDGRHDFDFWIGRWTIKNRRLLKPLSGSNEWETFDATAQARFILGGLGNEDDFVTPHRPGFIGMSLRFFDPATRLWSIYWIDNRMGVLQPPVVGRFVGSTGIFEGPDTHDGKPITVRYTWSRTDTPNPRWEQAFSLDGGKTWETNWVNEMTRVRAVEGAR